MKRNLALLAGVAAGTVAALLLRRRSGAEPISGPEPDPRAEELRRKLAQAREAAADEDDFEAAGMGPETLVEDAAEVDETRRRVHDDARSAADEMRRGGSPEGT